MKFAVIKESEIDFDTRKEAHMALAAARKELRLPMVRIKWFDLVAHVLNPVETFEHETDIRGLFKGADPDTIYIRDQLFPEDIKETVFHETFHLWQFRQGNGFGEHSEKLAQGYAEDKLKRIMTYGEDEAVYLEHMIGTDWSSSAAQTEPVKTFNIGGFIKCTKGINLPGTHKIAYGKIII